MKSFDKLRTGPRRFAGDSPKYPRRFAGLLIVAALMAIAALVEINLLASRIRDTEEDKVRLWAQAISQKAQLVDYSEQFFQQVGLDERRKMQLYADVLRSFNSMEAGSDVEFSLKYVRYIVDSSQTDIIITDRDSIITVPSELAGQKLQGPLLHEFSSNPPVHYTLWGMPMTLYYKESKTYTDLRHVLDGFSESFLSEITNNSVSVPVLIVDSLQGEVIGSGNIPLREFNTPERLDHKICAMQEANDPIVVRLPHITTAPAQPSTLNSQFSIHPGASPAIGQKAYIFYEDTPLLKALRWVPLVYLFVATVLILIALRLFRTVRANEQNRIWVGLAKETAHQLGTPISSLMAWTEYLRGKTLEGKYADEIDKDLQRLNTVTQRFSKIGSVPELKPQDLNEVIRHAVTYLQTRSSKKIKWSVIPSTSSGQAQLSTLNSQLSIPLNSYLFEWVIENLCKNAIDAMDGQGSITIVVSADAKHAYVDITDTGKGIPKSLQKKIFQSGFTTKQRGWGLGLSLARRIVVDYHRGRIFVKYSIEGQGTTFRIVLNR